MSALMGLLHGHVEPGVYVVPDDTGITELDRETASTHGWAIRETSGGIDKAAALAGVARALDFPSYFGGNLDALVDCLRDLPGPTVLLWTGWSVLSESDPGTLRAIVDVFTERSGAEPEFAVLLVGHGPDVGVPVIG